MEGRNFFRKVPYDSDSSTSMIRGHLNLIFIDILTKDDTNNETMRGHSVICSIKNSFCLSVKNKRDRQQVDMLGVRCIPVNWTIFFLCCYGSLLTSNFTSISILETN